MPKPRSADPRDRTLLLRLTASEMEMLEVVAHLERTTANAHAYSLLIEHLAMMAKEPHVERGLANRASYDARPAATTTKLQQSGAGKSRGPKPDQDRGQRLKGRGEAG
jgi:hypothetical protein